MQTEAKESAAPKALPDLSQEDAVVYEALRANGAAKLLAHNATPWIRAMTWLQRFRPCERS